MMPSPSVPHNFGYVYKLKKALYGLKQAPRVWFEKFSIVISSLRFTSSIHETTLFTKYTAAGCIILSSYVDDMIITGDDLDGIALLKTELAKQFEMNDMGSLRYFLDVEVA